MEKQHFLSKLDEILALLIFNVDTDVCGWLQSVKFF